MRLVGRGHPDIRATHRKTLEFSIDEQISGRATCVLAVDVRTADAAPLAGPVRISITVGAQTTVVHATANSAWEPGGAAVVRRSPMQLPGTVGIDADRAAADLPREFVAALQSPDAVVGIDIEPAEPDRPILVLAAVDATRPPDRRLRAELSAADAVVTEDAEARRFARRAGEPPRRNDADRRRTLVLATRELPGATVLDALADAGTAVETIGLLPQLAAAAACPSRAPVTIGSGRPVDALHRAPAAHRVVVRTEPDDLADLLAGVQELRPGTQAVITQQFTRPVRALHGAVPELPVDEVVYCCVSPAPAAGLDPPVAAAVRALLADGVPTRSAARALAELSGLSRRDAYELVLGMAGRGHGTPGTGPTASR